MTVYTKILTRPNPEYFSNLRWLAKFPFIDNICLGHGHTVPMNQPPLSFCPFTTFLFLPAIIRTDQELFESIEQQGYAIETLCVHLISPQEYDLIKVKDGLDEFLDLLDERDCPAVFDPARISFVA